MKILNHRVSKDGDHYILTATRETLPDSARARYRVWLRWETHAGTTRTDTIGTAFFHTAIDCQNWALSSAAAWLQDGAS